MWRLSGWTKRDPSLQCVSTTDLISRYFSKPYGEIALRFWRRNRKEFTSGLYASLWLSIANFIKCIAVEIWSSKFPDLTHSEKCWGLKAWAHCSCYKDLGIWLDDCLSFKLQVNNLLKKLRVRLGFFFRKKSCFSLEARKRLCDLFTFAGLWWSDLYECTCPLPEQLRCRLSQCTEICY